MCRTADTIFDGGLSDIRGDREYQRSRGYTAPVPAEPLKLGGATPEQLANLTRRPSWRELMSIPVNITPARLTDVADFL